MIRAVLTAPRTPAHALARRGRVAPVAAICAVFCAGLLAALFVGLPARANGAFETYGPGLRARAMANAAVAIDDVAAAHTNPAAVGRAPGSLVFQAGYALDMPATAVAFDKEKAEGDPLAAVLPRPVSGLHFGFLIPLDLVVEDRVFFGGAFYFPTQVLVRARAYDPQKPFFYAYDSSTEHYDASLAAGAKLLEWLYLGAGVRLAAGQTGDIQLAVDPVRGRLTNQAADTFQYPTAALTAGVLVGRLGLPRVLEGSLGVVYRDRSWFDIKLPATLTIEGADIEALLDVHIRANYSPRSVTSGLSLEIFEDTVVDAEAQAAFWSEAPPPYVVTRVDLGGAGLDAVGIGDGLDAPGPGQDRVVGPGFVDTLNWRVGVEHTTLDGMLALRAGYQHRPSPVPDQTSGTNIIDCNAHVVSAGFGLTFPLSAVFARPLTADLAYQVHILEPRAARKQSPIDDVGDWTASGVVHSLALGWTYRF